MERIGVTWSEFCRIKQLENTDLRDGKYFGTSSGKNFAGVR